MASSRQEARDKLARSLGFKSHYYMRKAQQQSKGLLDINEQRKLARKAVKGDVAAADRLKQDAVFRVEETTRSKKAPKGQRKFTTAEGLKVTRTAKGTEVIVGGPASSGAIDTHLARLANEGGAARVVRVTLQLTDGSIVQLFDHGGIRLESLMSMGGLSGVLADIADSDPGIYGNSDQIRRKSIEQIVVTVEP